MSNPHEVEAIEAVIPAEADSPAPKAFQLPERVKDGDRHTTLFRLLRSQKARGISYEGAVALCEVENRQRCDPPLPAEKCEWKRWWDQEDRSDWKRTREAGHERLDEIPHPPGSAAPKAAPLQGFTLQELTIHTFPVRRALLYRGKQAVFRQGHIGEIYAERGIGKSWLIHTLALVAAYGIEALGFRNPDPCRVLLIDGEMASEEIQERLVYLVRVLGIKLNTPLLNAGALTVVGADWQDGFLPRLDTPEGQAAIEPFIAPADLVFPDNRSCLFDSEGEKDPTAWQPAQNWLLSLRRRGKGVILGHHSNRQGGARGISKAEDPMNLLLKLTRPEDYSQDQGARFLVEFDKSRGFYGAAAAPFTTALTPEGWKLERCEGADDDINTKITQLLQQLAAVNELPKTTSEIVSKIGGNRNRGFAAVNTLLAAGIVTKGDDGRYRVVE
jgi:hypothetical protein